MKIEKTLVVPAQRAAVWDVLMDLSRVARAFPGVEGLEALDDDSYRGTMRVRVGPVSLRIAGAIHVLTRDRDDWRASLRLEGGDRRVGGGVRGTLDLTLNEAAVNETEVVMAGDVTFIGKLGELGQTVIRRKADSVVQEFASNLAREASGG
jgi:carbon monoxide dehydrogenase subunit G